MNISYPDSYFQTALFLTFFVSLVVLTAKKNRNSNVMSHLHTYELKGIAILMVIFSHIGYFLFLDHNFLYPLSVAGGVGVNIFLFLSGFGLASSENLLSKSTLEFYKKRLKSIFIPMWLVLTVFLLLDHFVLGRNYSFTLVLQNFLGFFPNSDIDISINSPLWYFTLILFYYLIFPLFYRKKRPILSALLILLAGYFMVNLNLPVTKDVLKLYKLHLFAFPFGILLAYIFNKNNVLKLKNRLGMIHLLAPKRNFLRLTLISILSIIFAYTAIHSSIGEKIISEALLSLVTAASLVFIIILMRVQSDILIILGRYSYEIYLVQWPLMYRYDFIYKHTPDFLGTLIYIAFFVFTGYLMKNFLYSFLKSKTSN